MFDNFRFSNTRKRGALLLPAIDSTSHLALESGILKAKAFAENSKANSTRLSYESDFAHFQAFCERMGFEALPASPQAVAIYASELAESKAVSTIQRRVAAISHHHQSNGLDSPTLHPAVKTVLKGIRRSKGTAAQQKAAVSVTTLRTMVQNLPTRRLIGARDTALILVGFFGAFRRSELVALNVEDVAFEPDGLVVTIRRSKTDQIAEGRTIGIPFGASSDTCPVRALRAWLMKAEISSGPLFRGINRHGKVCSERLSPTGVARAVKRAAEAIGLDSSEFAGHSLRSGFATSAARAGASERSIMEQTGHKSIVVARRYIRRGSVWQDNAASSITL